PAADRRRRGSDLRHPRRRRGLRPLLRRRRDLPGRHGLRAGAGSGSGGPRSLLPGVGVVRRARLLLATTTIAAIAIAIAMTSATARATAFAQPRRERLASPSDAAWVVANQGGAVALRGDR